MMELVDNNTKTVILKTHSRIQRKTQHEKEGNGRHKNNPNGTPRDEKYNDRNKNTLDGKKYVRHYGRTDNLKTTATETTQNEAQGEKRLN